MNCRILLLLALFSTLAIAAPAQTDDVASLRAKAEKGNVIAQYNLGLAYAEGRGIAADPVEAFVWFSLAVERGARDQALEALARTLTPEQLAAGRSRLAERRAALAAVTGGAAAPADAKAVPGEDPALTRLRRERDALSAKLEELVADIAAFRADRERLQQNVADLSQQLERANFSREAAAKLAADAERQALRVRMEELQRTAARVPELEASLAAAETAKAGLQRQSDELRASTAGLTTANAQAGEVQTQLARAKTRLEELEGANTALSADLAAARKAADDLRAGAQNMDKKLADDRRQGEEAQASLRKTIGDLQAELASTQSAASKLADAGAKMAELESRLTAAQAEIARAAARDEASKKAEARTAGPAVAPADIDELKRRLDEAESKLEVSLRGYAALEAEGKRLEAEAGEKLAVSLRGYAALEAERDRLAADLAKAGQGAAVIERLQRERDALAAENARLGAIKSPPVADSPAPVQAPASVPAPDQTREKLEASLRAYALLETERTGLAAGKAEAEARVARLEKELAAFRAESGRDGAVAERPSPVAVERVPASPARTEEPRADGASVRTHTVVYGETLSGIAQRYYGTPARWAEIYNANLELLRTESALRAGMTLRIP